MPEPVPTSADLVNMGPEYAEAVGWASAKKGQNANKPTVVRITTKGHALIGDILRRNATEARQISDSPEGEEDENGEPLRG